MEINGTQRLLLIIRGIKSIWAKSSLISNIFSLILLNFEIFFLGKMENINSQIRI